MLDDTDVTISTFLFQVGGLEPFQCQFRGTLVEKCCHYFNLIDLLPENLLSVYASGEQPTVCDTARTFRLSPCKTLLT